MQLSNLNQEVRRVKSDSRLQRQVSHVVMNETGVLKDAVQLLQQHLDELRLAQQQQANQCGRLQHQVSVWHSTRFCENLSNVSQ